MLSQSTRPRRGSGRIAQLAAMMLSFNAVGADYQFEQVYSFGGSGDNGIFSTAALIEGDDGSLYGTTVLGGKARGGSVFRMWKTGAEFEVIRSFTEQDGRRPTAPVIKGGDGYLYGTTTWAVSANNATGFTNSGTLYRLKFDGSDFKTLKVFPETRGEGFEPGSALLLANDGRLYGTTPLGGAQGAGTIFRINRDGTGFTVLFSFGTGFGQPQTPRCALLEGADGQLLGTSELGGVGGAGTVFSIAKDGTGLVVLKNFLSGFEGGQPIAGLTRGSDGRYYGTTSTGGPNGGGAVYTIGADGSDFSVLKTFTPTEGSGFYAGVTEITSGKIYCISAFGGPSEGGAVFRMNKDGSQFQTVRGFTATVGDPQWTFGAVFQASDGVLYGTSGRGGQYGVGTVFRMQPDGTEFKVLKSFANTGVDSTRPQAGVTLATDGYLYGTAREGGEFGQGTIYRLQTDGGGFGVVHTFGLDPRDGTIPKGGVTELLNGILIGTASRGGVANLGTLYRLAKDGSGFTVLRRFTGAPSDGAEPTDDLIQASDGLVYGPTFAGGAANLGTLFRLKADGSEYQVLRSFTGAPADGASPGGPLLEASDGMLYGTTFEGGANDLGTLFRLKKDGSAYSVLISFSAAAPGPQRPAGKLVEGPDGRIYGASPYGGNTGGTVFAVNKDGTGLVVLLALPTKPNDGRTPATGVTFDGGGRLWAASNAGGQTGFGTVFSLNRDGTDYQTAYSFSREPGSGFATAGSLFSFGGSTMYGITILGGQDNVGTIYRVSGPNAVRIDSFSQIGFGGSRLATIGVKAPAGWSCLLETSPVAAGQPWTEVTTRVADAGGDALFSDSFDASVATRFYRVVATPGTAANP